MFENKKKKLEERQRVKGLSRALSIVDTYMMSGLSPEALDRAYGQAYAEIRMEYINGDIPENDMWAALATLDNQYNKLRPKALEALLYA